MMREFVSCICKLRSWAFRFFVFCFLCVLHLLFFSFFKVNILCMHLELHSNCIARAKQKQMRTFIAHTLLSTLIRYKNCVPSVFLFARSIQSFVRHDVCIISCYTFDIIQRMQFNISRSANTIALQLKFMRFGSVYLELNERTTTSSSLADWYIERCSRLEYCLRIEYHHY